MSDSDSRSLVVWERTNEDFLSAALYWLRLRLRRLAASNASRRSGSDADESNPQRSSRSGGWFSRRETEPAFSSPRTGAGPTDAEIDEAAATMEKAAAAEPPPALYLLSRRLGLSPFERDALLLCAGLELNPAIAGLCAEAQGEPSRPYPTFALLLCLFDDAAWDALSPERPLRYWQLLTVGTSGAEPLTTRPLRADERIVNYIKGLNYLDDRLTPFLVPFDVPVSSSLPSSQEAGVDRIAEIIRGSGERIPLIQLAGIDPRSKQLVARRAADRLGLNLYRLPASSLPSDTGDLETMVRLWHRESLLLPIALFLDAHEDGDAPAGEQDAASRQRSLGRFLLRHPGPLFLSTREIRGDLRSDVRAVTVDKPTPAEQISAWRDAIGVEDGAADLPGLLAGQFHLNASTIRDIADGIEQTAGDRPRIELRDRLWDACLERTSPRMDRLAERLRPVATWDDLVLPDDEHALLRQLAEQVAHRSAVYDDWGFRSRMNRGFGISALFAGESGTGKTMAAEVIANDLRLALYRIDLSAVVSKYIGETETNLRRLFDAAENGGAILFFDEADALFGKRSEVRDSHDRYANIEINYLLQRMEAYRGLAILATNMKGALDQAFVRRLRFVVTFPFPGRPEREAIWRRAWPAETPTRDLDYAHLARFSLTGGSIANVALHAAFRASAQGSAVTMPVVLGALRTELRKLERPVNDANLAWDDPVPAADARGAEPTASPSPPDRSPTPAGA
jgi:hypothetical protein